MQASSPHTRSTPDLSTPSPSIFHAANTTPGADDGDEGWVTDDGEEGDELGGRATCLAVHDRLVQGCWEVEATLPSGRGVFDQAAIVRVVRVPGSDSAADGSMPAAAAGELCALNVLHASMLLSTEDGGDGDGEGGEGGGDPLAIAQLPAWLELRPHPHVVNVLALEVDYERGLLLLLEREGRSLRAALDGGGGEAAVAAAAAGAEEEAGGEEGEEAAAAACREALSLGEGVIAVAQQLVAALSHLHGGGKEAAAAAEASVPPIYGALAAGLDSVRVCAPRGVSSAAGGAAAAQGEGDGGGEGGGFAVKLCCSALSSRRSAVEMGAPSSLSDRMQAVRLDGEADAAAADVDAPGGGGATAADDVAGLGKVLLQLEMRRRGCQSADELRTQAAAGLGADEADGPSLLAALALELSAADGAAPPPPLAEVRARVAALAAKPPAPSHPRAVPAASLAFRRGLWRHGLSDAAGAAELYRTAIAADGAHVPAMMASASILDEVEDDPEGAETVWKRVLALDAGHAGSLTKMADLMDQLYGAADQAEAMYRRAIAAEPANTDALLGLGSLLFEKAEGLGEADAAVCVAEAEQLWRGAVELDPRDCRSLCNLGSLLASSGKADAEAEGFFRQALAAAPGGFDEEALANLAMLLEQSGRADEAAQLRELAEQPQPDV
jgi:tetratricopeptide (TPR) repeat protein